MFQLPFNFKQQKPPSNFLTVDIGSNDVKVMAFELKSDTEPSKAKASIVGISQKHILPNSTRSGSILDVDNVTTAIRDAIDDVQPEGVVLKDAVFGVSGIYGTGFMITVKVGRAKQNPISAKEIQENFDKVHEEAYAIAQSIFHDTTGESDQELKMIVSSVVYAKLDGVLMEDLEGKHGKRIELAVYTAFTPNYHYDAIQTICNKLGLNLVAVAPTTYGLTKSLSYSKGTDYDSVIIDVGGGISDVAVIFGGGIVASRSIDVGGNHFTKALERGLSLNSHDALQKKISYSYGKLNESEDMIVKGYIDTCLDVWMHGLEIVFSDFTGVKTFAPYVYVVGGGMLLPDLFDVLVKEPWTKSVPFKSLPEFSKLSVEDLPLVEDRTGNAYALDLIIPAALSVVYLEAKGLLD